MTKSKVQITNHMAATVFLASDKIRYLLQCNHHLPKLHPLYQILGALATTHSYCYLSDIQHPSSTRLYQTIPVCQLLLDQMLRMVKVG